jgi:hypothetical protein
MRYSLQPVRVATGFDEEGMLLFDDKRRPVAALTDPGDHYGGVSGHWYLETGYGPLDGLNPPPTPPWTPLRIGSPSASPIELDQG